MYQSPKLVSISTINSAYGYSSMGAVCADVNAVANVNAGVNVNVGAAVNAGVGVNAGAVALVIVAVLGSIGPAGDDDARVVAGEPYRPFAPKPPAAPTAA